MGIIIHAHDCVWSTHSDIDERFNLSGNCYGVFDTTPMEEAIKQVEEKYSIKRPKDLTMSIFKD